MPSPQVHGHRGCRGLFPENTLPAFLHAATLGVDTLEMDVVLSADGEVVVSHEPWFSALLCRDPTGQPIRAEQEKQHNLYRLPYDVIRRYDCGSTPHPHFPQQQLLPASKPLLREVLAAVEAHCRQVGRKPINYSIEIKTEPGGTAIFHPGPEAFVSAVVAVLEVAGVHSRTTLLSFDKAILQAARLSFPTFLLCLLVEDQEPFAKHLQMLGFVPNVYGPEFPLVTSALVDELQLLQIDLVPWTVNELADMQHLLSFPIAGITTDYPNTLLQLLNRL